MTNYDTIITKLPLFDQIEPENIHAMMGCIKARTKKYKAGEYLFTVGDKADFIGIVLEGTVHILQDDYDGKRNLTGALTTGNMFAEAFACAGVDRIPVDGLAATDCTVMFMDKGSMLSQCCENCEFHNRLIQNLLKIVARKNMMLNQKLGYILHKTTAEKLMAYLTDQAKHHGSDEFTIPFDRQALADFLGVERSAMSVEISKLKKAGVIDTKKNWFKLLQ